MRMLTRLIGLMIGLLIPLLLVIFCMFGCVEEEDVYIVPGGHETIDGIYRVHVAETFDTCDEESEFIKRWDWLLVTVQEKYQDGGYLVDFSLSDLAWYEVKVDSDGQFEATYDFFGIFAQNMYGTITSEEIYATIELPMYDYDGNQVCITAYNVEGYKLFATLPPPEDMER